MILSQPKKAANYINLGGSTPTGRKIKATKQDARTYTYHHAYSGHKEDIEKLISHRHICWSRNGLPACTDLENLFKRI